MRKSSKKRIAIIGGGPSALFIYKRLVQSGRTDISVDIFERKEHLGQGMPYSSEGANLEQITNVSGNELPELPISLAQWVRALPQSRLDHYQLRRESFDENKVLPRLLFGEYLESQFSLLLAQGQETGLQTVVHLRSVVSDIRDLSDSKEIAVMAGTEHVFDRVVICSGHNWPQSHEGEAAGYYASPYPPSKLAKPFDHSIAIRGSSLTAVDAIRTLARNNGGFVRESLSKQRFEPAGDNFKIVMHTRSGLLPCIRFHLDDPQVSDDGLLQAEDLERARRENDGFIPLDLVFEEDFKALLRAKDPGLYEQIQAMSLEEFVDAAMDSRERSDPFEYFKAEYGEALTSLARGQTIAWKEVLAVLSFAVNYPAKHFSAEDSLRLQHVLAPLISIVIAFIPQGSCEELIALHEAGRLELVSVGSDSAVEVAQEGGVMYHYDSISRHYQTYIDCVGQPHLPVKAFPFPTLIEQNVVRQARLAFRSAENALAQQHKDRDSVQQDADGSYHLIVPGIAINDGYQPLNWASQANLRVQIMAVPYIGGHNPDYSGLDFCEEGSRRIVNALLDSLAE